MPPVCDVGLEIELGMEQAPGKIIVTLDNIRTITKGLPVNITFMIRFNLVNSGIKMELLNRLKGRILLATKNHFESLDFKQHRDGF